MSDITSTLRTQEIAERVHAQYARTQGISVQTPQAVFPEDRVELSSDAQKLVAGETTSDTQASFRQSVLAEGDDALSRMTVRLNRLMSVYGVNSSQTTISGHKVVDVLQNELKRLVGTVEPPTIDNQVKQELNFIVRQMEIKADFLDGLDDDGTAASVSVEIGDASLEWGDPGQSGALLAAPGTLGVTEDGRSVDLSQVGNGVYHLDPTVSPDGSSSFDRNAGRLSSDAGAAGSRPDLNHDGARNEADGAVGVVIVNDAESQNRQAATGLAQFVADLAVPIAVRAAEATPSRPQAFEERD